MPVEIVATPVSGGAVQRFQKDLIELGRLPDLDLPLDAHGGLISRHHAAIFREDDGELYVRDMGSRSGTFLNGERVREPVNVLPEDVIQLGGRGGPAFRFELVRTSALPPTTATKKPRPPSNPPVPSSPRVETPSDSGTPPELAKRSDRKRLLGHSTLTVALDAVVARERARSNRIVTIAAAASVLSILLILISAVTIHGRRVATLEATHATELASAKAEEQSLHERIESLRSELAQKESALDTARSRGELALKLAKETSTLKKELATQKEALDQKKRAEAVGALAGTFDLTTSEPGSSGTGVFLIYGDGSIVRGVAYPDGLYRTRWGTATALDGAQLKVAFDGPGDPRDLSGRWAVHGDGPTGRYSGACSLEKIDDAWATSFVTVQNGESSDAVQLLARLTDRTLTGERSVAGGASQTVHYQLSSSGLELKATFGQATETLTRRRLPSGPASGTTAVYRLDGSKLTGTLASGEKDQGTRRRAAAPGELTAGSKPGVRDDPVPLRLAALRETRLLRAPREDAQILLTLKAGFAFEISGSENQCWKVRVKTENGDTFAYVLKSDVQACSVRYKAVTGPLLTGAPSASGAQQLDLGICYLIAALMSIARVQPDAIREMVKDERDGTASVRFFQRDEHGRLEPVWHRINKTVTVDDEGHAHYADGGEGQMWCPIVVKAYASVHGGGFYGGIAGGLQNSIFECVTGREAVVERTGPILPTDVDVADLKALRLGAADLAFLQALPRKKSYTAERESLRDNPSRRGSLDHWSEVLDRLVAAGLSEDGRQKLREYYRARCVGKLGSGKYSTGAKDLWKTIHDALERRSPVGLDTYPWGRGGTGQSAGENTEVVPGLVAKHAYSVIETSEHDGLLWVKVANPWHQFRRRYAHEGDKWRLTATSDDPRQKTPGDTGEFEVELSDVVRYFQFVEYLK